MLALKRKREAQAKAAATCSLSVAENARSKRTPAEIRIQKDLALLQEDEAASITFPNRNDLTKFRLSVVPKEGLWMGGTFDFDFVVEPDYPFSPPRVSCKTKIVDHPNISYYDGRVCSGLRELWRPVHDVRMVVNGIVAIFYEPALDIAVNHCALDVLAPELLRHVTAFLDEESLMKFFVVSMASIPHQYIFMREASRIVKERFISLQDLLQQPGPTVPRAVIDFVARYKAFVEQEDAANRLPSEPLLNNAGISQRAEVFAGGRPEQPPQQEEEQEDDDDDSYDIVHVIRRLSGRLAILNYFRDTVANNTNQDIMWPVWCGKLQLAVRWGVDVSPCSIVSTSVWHPSIFQRCTQIFASEYYTIPMWPMEFRVPLVVASVSGISAKDAEDLRSVSKQRLVRRRGTGWDQNFLAVAAPHEALGIVRVGGDVRAAPPPPHINNERIVRVQTAFSQLLCFWEHRNTERLDAAISCEDFTDHVVDFLTKRKSLQLLSAHPGRWQAGDWAEPAVLVTHRPTQLRG